jgi:hypothetical protein
MEYIFQYETNELIIPCGLILSNFGFYPGFYDDRQYGIAARNNLTFTFGGCKGRNELQVIRPGVRNTNTTA